MMHSELVTALTKPSSEILDSLHTGKISILHAAIGIAGEAGELLDQVKKHVIYNKPLDSENLVEELGDLEFYLEMLRQAASITRQDTLDRNIAKLSIRYAEGYSDQAAQARADKMTA